MADSRLEQYFVDCEELLKKASGPTAAASSHKAIVAEVRKLTTYIQKHQNETVQTASQTKLVMTIAPERKKKRRGKEENEEGERRRRKTKEKEKGRRENEKEGGTKPAFTARRANRVTDSTPRAYLS